MQGMTTPRSAIILFAHGARDPRWAEPFMRLAARIASSLPDTAVRLAFLELMQPSLLDCIGALVDQGIEQVTVVPAFMAQGAHLREDLPKLIDEARGRYEGVRIELTEALGEAEPVLEAMAGWVVERSIEK